MDERNKPIGIIVLAAGSSRRMKKSKQLLEFEGVTLLRRAALAASESVCQPVMVILGADFENIKAEVEDLPVEICLNKNWQNGLSSSIATGIKCLLKAEPNVSAAIITLADQPFVTSKHINSFAEKFYQLKKPLIAAEYSGTIGVPALFAKEVFDDLIGLSGDRGAKSFLAQRRADLEIIKLPEAVSDIDTPSDFEKLESLSNQP